MSTVKGRVRKFGNNIDTDVITPAVWLQLSVEEISQHVFEPISKDFPQTVQENDIIVAGHNFGCGSSREQATEVMKVLGIQYIVCESMARIYFRNCISTGMYPIISKDVSQIFAEGDEIEIDIDNGKVTNPKTGKTTSFEPLSGMVDQIRRAGGILAQLQKKLAQKDI